MKACLNIQSVPRSKHIVTVIKTHKTHKYTVWAELGISDYFLPSSGLLHGVRCFKTDVSGLPITPIFKGEAVLDMAV